MKKRTKITLRTKIYLTIVGAVSAHRSVLRRQSNNLLFTTSAPLAHWACSRLAVTVIWFMTEFCTENIYTVDCNGNVLLFADIPPVWSLPGKIPGYRSIASAACRVHPARRFHHTRRFVF